MAIKLFISDLDDSLLRDDQTIGERTERALHALEERGVTIALASLLIGSTVLGRGGIFLRAVGAVLGAIIFRLVYTVALRLDMPAFMLKLVSAVIVVLAISVPYLKTQLPVIRRRIQRKAD